LIGAGCTNTIISYDDHATKLFDNGEVYGTFRSYTVYVSGNDFSAHSLSFVNSAGKGKDVGQSLAFYGDGDRHSFFNCAFIAHQDTLFLSPLPPKPIIPNSFNTSGKMESTIFHRSYFENCTIQGDVDFIFGGGVAYFESCEIISVDLGQEINGYITAASTPEGQKHGFVFNNCRLTSEAAPGTVYLGRPWRDFAKTVFINCEMGAHIHPEGWHDWNKATAHETALYAEYGSIGLGSDTNRTPWAKQLSQEQVTEMTVDVVLSGWNPPV